jgi:hypothetical protein
LLGYDRLGFKGAEFVSVVGLYSVSNALEKDTSSACTVHVPTRLGMPESAKQIAVPNKNANKVKLITIFFIVSLLFLIKLC